MSGPPYLLGRILKVYIEPLREFRHDFSPDGPKKPIALLSLCP